MKIRLELWQIILIFGGLLLFISVVCLASGIAGGLSQVRPDLFIIPSRTPTNTLTPTVTLTCTPSPFPTFPPTITNSPTATRTATLLPTGEPTRTSQPSATVTNTPPAITLGSLQVHFIDVGQGDAILILAPDGKTILIDGGGKESGIVDYLKSQKVKQIDMMIATNPGEEHIGGLVEVLKWLPVTTVITNGQKLGDNLTYVRFINAIASEPAGYEEKWTDRPFKVGDLLFTVLNPSTHDTAEKETQNHSLVLQFKYGNTTFLLMSDAGKEVEMRLLAEQAPLKADILKIGNHASRTSSVMTFVQAVKPGLAIYSTARKNSFGTPHQDVINEYLDIGANVYGTERNGTVIVTVDASTYAVYINHGQAW